MMTHDCSFKIHLYRNVKNLDWLPIIESESQLVVLREALEEEAERNVWPITHVGTPPNNCHTTYFGHCTNYGLSQVE